MQYPESEWNVPFEFVTGTPDEAERLLSFFLWESPSSMIPPHYVVAEWANVLARRGAEFADLVAMCQECIGPTNARLVFKDPQQRL